MEKTDSIPLEQLLAEMIKALESLDMLTQNRGVEQAIQLGSLAVPELVKMYAKPDIPHAQVTFALCKIADKQAAATFLQGLNHPDERVRAYSAQGLAGIGHPEAMSACLKTINDAPDPLHLDITPSVYGLGEMGLPVIPFLLDLMLHNDEMTRLHAQRALEQVVDRQYGIDYGTGSSDPLAVEKASAQWKANGDYAYDAAEPSRIAAVAKWRHWLKEKME